MPTRAEIIGGFRQLLKDLGPDAEPYININHFWEQKEILNEWRTQLEKHIGQQYLPGFKFESPAHFKWHFQFLDDPYILLRGRSLESYFEQWLRAIMVPRVLHYRAEIAFALKAWESANRWKIEANKMWNDSWTWEARVREILSFKPIIGFDEPESSVDKKTIFRWARSAEKFRRDRTREQPPSGWHIYKINLPQDFSITLCYPNGTPFFLSHEYDHNTIIKELEDPKGYRETWKWSPIPGQMAPLCDSITFCTPATAAIWQKHWKNKRRFRISCG